MQVLRTRAGAAAAAAAPALAAGVARQLAGRLSPEELERSTASLRRIADTGQAGA